MTLPRRIWGLETEYGITCAPTAGGPPPLDADAAARLMFEPVVQRFRTSNYFGANGGRLYLDVGSHPEYATAECDRLEDLLAQDRVGTEAVADLAVGASERLREGGTDAQIHVFRNNLDSVGNSFGCHENYLVRRRPNYKAMVATLVPYLVTRQIVAGAGHVRHVGGRVQYCFSQRADQMWDAFSSATTRSRPIVNTRDEPHADVNEYRRMHVIVGDSNMAEGATLLKVAATDLLLAMVEAGERFRLELADPMTAIREVSADVTGSVAVELTDGRRLTPVQIQRYYLDAVRAAFPTLAGLHARAIDLWDRGLTAVETGDHGLVATELDWAIKERLVTRYLQRDGATGPGLQRLLLAYHEVAGLRLRDRLEAQGAMVRLTTPDQVDHARTEPPATTRAAARGTFVRAAMERRRDYAVDWVNLRLADPTTRTVMLYDPFSPADPRVDDLIAAMDA